MPIFCTKCGVQNQDEDYYCFACGARLVRKVSAKQSFLGQSDLPISQPVSSYRREAYPIQTDVLTSQFNQIRLAFGGFGVLGLLLLLDYFLGFFSTFHVFGGPLMGLMAYTIPFVGAYLFLAISFFSYSSNITVVNSLSRDGRIIGQLLFLITAIIIIDGFFELLYILEIALLADFFIIRIAIIILTDSLIFIAFYKSSNWISTILTLSDIRISFQPKLLLLFSVLMLVSDSFYILAYYLQIILAPMFLDGTYLIVQFVRIIAGFSIYSIPDQTQH